MTKPKRRRVKRRPSHVTWRQLDVREAGAHDAATKISQVGDDPRDPKVVAKPTGRRRRAQMKQWVDNHRESDERAAALIAELGYLGYLDRLREERGG